MMHQMYWKFSDRTDKSTILSGRKYYAWYERKSKRIYYGFMRQIDTHEKWLIKHQNADIKEEFIVRGSLATLVVVKDDLQNRLNELI